MFPLRVESTKSEFGIHPFQTYFRIVIKKNLVRILTFSARIFSQIWEEAVGNWKWRK